MISEIDEAVGKILLKSPAPTETIWIEGADHFFQGIPTSPVSKLEVMKQAMHSWLIKTYIFPEFTEKSSS